MEFKDIQEFFKSWGMYPVEEDTDELNEEVVAQGINVRCYGKMCEEAERLYGKEVAGNIAACVDDMDDFFYLAADTWYEVKEMWDNNG